MIRYALACAAVCAALVAGQARGGTSTPAGYCGPDTPAAIHAQRAAAWRAVRVTFGRYAGEALRVVRCETCGTFSPLAANGQYLGMFQMGDYARGKYGHGSTALAQARAAYRYFVATGRGWSPWSCKP